MMIKPLYRKILVLEDNNVAANAAIRILSQCGFEVVHAGCGKQALMEILIYNFDLILLDIDLPDITGIEVAQAIRKNSSQNQCTRMIALTAAFTPQREQACLEVGIERVLEKPLTRAVAKALIPIQLSAKPACHCACTASEVKPKARVKKKTS
jgi:two-component system, OmpR family, aerobic respiration control sensor histidine kinase ArcB